MQLTGAGRPLYYHTITLKTATSAEDGVFEWGGQWPTRRWIRLAVVLGVAAAILYLFVATFGLLVPFLIGLLIAYLILPAVDWLDRAFSRVLRRGAARMLAIVVVYLLGLALIAALFLFFVPVVVDQVQQLLANREQIANTIQAQLAGLREFITTSVPSVIRDLVQSQLQALAERLRSLSGSLVTGALSSLGGILVTVFGFVIIPFWLVYVFYDAGKFGRGTIGLFPEEVRPDVVNIGRLFDDIVLAYVRGQLVVAAIVGTLTGFGLSLVGVNFAALLGLITAIGDLIPTLGPILAAVPTVLIAVLERPILGLWALLILIGVQQLENVFIGPRIVGDSVRLSPAVIIVLLVIAGQLFGLLGLLIVVPITAYARDLVRYLLLRTGPEPVSPDGALYQVRKARLGD
jgi:predicted PurR-regulated permease PerM